MVFHCTISRIKGDHYYIQTRYNDFFSHCNPSYSGKTLRKIVSKSARKYWASTSGGAHTPLGIPQYSLKLINSIWLVKGDRILVLQKNNKYHRLYNSHFLRPQKRYVDPRKFLNNVTSCACNILSSAKVILGVSKPLGSINTSKCFKGRIWTNIFIKNVGDCCK